MDWCFNKCIPKSTQSRVILKPTSKTWVNGLASSYDNKYPQLLIGKLDEKDFAQSIEAINSTLFNYWPCLFCFTFGYCFCLCTFGLSFCPGCCCVSEAKQQLKRVIYHINQRYEEKPIEWKYISKCSTSWIEIIVN